MSAWERFLYYGKGDLAEECEYDLKELIMQHSRTLYYYRSASGGIAGYKNYPNALSLQLLAPYEISNAVAYRNKQVTDGSNGTKDRRIAVSQNYITFVAKDSDLDVKILYFLYANYEKPILNSIPVSG